MSYRVPAKALDEPKPLEWLRWLDRLQKSVCARYTGAPLRAFAHERPTPATLTDDGLLRAKFGEVEIAANLGTQPRGALAAYGFRATAPGLVAARLQTVGDRDCGADGISFVAEGAAAKMDIWIFAPAGSAVAVELPATPPSAARLTLEGAGALPVTLEGNSASFRLPDDASRTASPWLWHAMLTAP
jgi:poly-gamma-glutamate capsule biosynthesis protein CapA/YwtB (metallophosphatase superfamily)